MDDWPDDEDTRDFLRRALEEMAPMLKASVCSMPLVPDGEGDPKFWVELGASIMFEKPIILLVAEGRSIPQKLQKVADEIVIAPREVEGWSSEEFGREVDAAMRRVLRDG